MPSLIQAGRALTQIGEDGKHLWFVLTDPDPKTKKVVVVMLVTARNHTDKTVALGPGAHPFITRDSNVAYGNASFAPLSRLEAKLSSGSAKIKADMSSKLLKQVREGLLASTRTPNDVKNYCAEIF